jgi:hypothetical protein
MKNVIRIDLFKEHKAEYKAPKKPQLVETTPAFYLAIEGQGEPGGEDFTSKIGAMYGMAFTVKMTRKSEGKGDYAICKLEACWQFESDNQKDWRWVLMIRTPDMVEAADLAAAASKLEEKGKGDHVREVRLEKISEGRCVQMLHVGPYDKEVETVQNMEQFAREQGLEFHGEHHEIYISDPRRTPPERLKTILRRPVRKA